MYSKSRLVIIAPPYWRV